MKWRDIKCGDVAWGRILPKSRSAWKISRQCRVSTIRGDGEWAALTLGEVCDLGIREWERIGGWGPKVTVAFKDALRKIAKDPSIAVTNIAIDAFDPETE
jgi:hypothetical protein